MTVTFAKASEKLGKVAAATRKIAEEVFDAAAEAGHEIWYIWGMGSDVEHGSGRALDFMVRDHAGGQWIRNYMWANRKRLRLTHVIWEQHITSTVVSPGAVRKMKDRGNPTANHFDHVHALFFAGTYTKPDKVVTPPPTKFVLKNGHLEVDGLLGPQTIGRWQQVLGMPITGEIDGDLVEAVQIRLKATVDHRLVVNGLVSEIVQGGKGTKTVGALQRYLGSPVDTIIDKGRSNVVVALQRRLNTGRF